MPSISKSFALIPAAGKTCLFILTALALKDFKSFEEEASCAAAVEAAVMVSLLGKMVFDR